MIFGFLSCQEGTSEWRKSAMLCTWAFSACKLVFNIRPSVLMYVGLPSFRFWNCDVKMHLCTGFKIFDFNCIIYYRTSLNLVLLTEGSWPFTYRSWMGDVLNTPQPAKGLDGV